MFDSALCPPHSAAQDYPKWGLAEGAKVRIGKGRISEIQYSPDGTRLAVASSIGIRLTFEIGGQAWGMSIDGGKPEPMRRNYVSSSWSSDGVSYLAIGRNGELLRVSLGGVKLKELPFRVPRDARPLSMSPDG